MRLNSPLVTSFSYGGKEYAIDLAFDNVLDVFDVLADANLRDYEMAELCLILLLGEDFETEKVIDLWNYIYEQFIHIKSKELVIYDRKGNPMPVQEDDDKKQLIDLDVDADKIYASFQQAYNIDLFDVQQDFHWHKFKALLNGLPGGTVLSRVIQIRSWKPSKHDSAEYKQEMIKLQKIHALQEEVEE